MQLTRVRCRGDRHMTTQAYLLEIGHSRRYGLECANCGFNAVRAETIEYHKRLCKISVGLIDVD